MLKVKLFSKDIFRYFASIFRINILAKYLKIKTLIKYK